MFKGCPLFHYMCSMIHYMLTHWYMVKCRSYTLHHSGLHGLYGLWAPWTLTPWTLWTLGSMDSMDSGLHGLWAPWTLGSMDSGLHGLWVPWTLGSMDSGFHRLWTLDMELEALNTAWTTHLSYHSYSQSHRILCNRLTLASPRAHKYR